MYIYIYMYICSTVVPCCFSACGDRGVFKFPPRECMQKAAALYSLALQVRWFSADMGQNWMTRSPKGIGSTTVASLSS